MWVNCPECDLKDECKYYAQMKQESLKQKDQVCVKGCK